MKYFLTIALVACGFVSARAASAEASGPAKAAPKAKIGQGWAGKWVKAPKDGNVFWPVPGAEFDWGKSGVVRDVFIDPRRPLPTPLPGALASAVGDIPSLSSLGMGTDEKPQKQNSEASKSAQMGFWEQASGSFPSIVSRVMMPGGRGWITWSNGKRQSVGESVSFQLDFSKDKRQGARSRVSAAAAGLANPQNDKVDFTLEALLDGNVVISLSAFGNTYLLPSERVLWALPWSWFGYLSPSVAQYARGSGPGLSDQFNQMMGSKSVAVHQAPVSVTAPGLEVRPSAVPGNAMSGLPGVGPAGGSALEALAASQNAPALKEVVGGGKGGAVEGNPVPSAPVRSSLLRPAVEDPKENPASHGGDVQPDDVLPK